MMQTRGVQGVWGVGRDPGEGGGEYGEKLAFWLYILIRYPGGGLGTVAHPPALYAYDANHTTWHTNFPVNVSISQLLHER